MAILYYITRRKNFKDPEGDPLWYAIARRFQMITRDHLLQDIVRHTSLTKPEAAAAIDYLFEMIPNYLELGMSVRLGPVGSFRCTASYDVADHHTEVTVHHIRNVKLKFFPGKSLRDAINSVPIEKYDPPV